MQVEVKKKKEKEKEIYKLKKILNTSISLL